jgi:hypothetical protein
VKSSSRKKLTEASLREDEVELLSLSLSLVLCGGVEIFGVEERDWAPSFFLRLESSVKAWFGQGYEQNGEVIIAMDETFILENERVREIGTWGPRICQKQYSKGTRRLPRHWLFLDTSQLSSKG